MKKLLSIAVASFAVAALADPFSPTIGVTQINTTNKNTVIAVPFSALNGSGAIAARDLVSTNGLPTGTCLYIFNGTSYSGWTLIPGQGWTPATAAQATTSMPAITAPDTAQTLTTGSAIFVALPTAPASGGQNISIYGRFVTPTTTTVSAGNNLVANPLQSAATFSIESPVSGDEIVIPQDGVNARYIYKVNTRTQVAAWRKDNASVQLPQIPIGTGFWYIRTANAADATITWAAAQ